MPLGIGDAGICDANLDRLRGALLDGARLDRGDLMEPLPRVFQPPGGAQSMSCKVPKLMIENGDDRCALLHVWTHFSLLMRVLQRYPGLSPRPEALPLAM